MKPFLTRSLARWPLTVVALLTMLPSGCGTTQAQSPWTSWTTVRLKAKGVPLMTGRIEMRFEKEDDRTLLHTQTRAKFFGAVVARSRTESVLHPVSLATRHHYSVSKKRGRRYTFNDTGYTMEKLKPLDDPTAPIERWEVRSSQRFETPLDEKGRPLPLYDYYAMLLHLRDADLEKPGDVHTVYLATKDGPRAYTIEVGEVRAGERTFTDLRTDQQKTLATRELRLRVVPTDPEHADEGFLDMEGETELWVEAGSKTLLEVVGKVPKVPGQVQLVLFEMG